MSDVRGKDGVPHDGLPQTSEYCVPAEPEKRCIEERELHIHTSCDRFQSRDRFNSLNVVSGGYERTKTGGMESKHHRNCDKKVTPKSKALNA
jgi:hypothetical protein